MKSVKMLSLAVVLGVMSSYASQAQQTNSVQDVVEAVQTAIMSAERPAGDGPWVIEEPSRNYYHFGAVLDLQYRVLTLTPGSDAERAGMKVGDKALRINDIEFNENRIESILKTLNDMEDDQPLHIQVNRAGKVLNLKTTATRTTIPAWRLEVNPSQSSAAQRSTHVADTEMTTGCGFLSVFYSPPVPNNEEIYPARIQAVDNEDFSDQLNLGATDVIKVPAGMRTIELQERIVSHRIRRHRADVREQRKQLPQTIQLHVEPNKVYHFVSRYFFDFDARVDPKQYWEPVVWRVTDRQCG